MENPEYQQHAEPPSGRRLELVSWSTDEPFVVEIKSRSRGREAEIVASLISELRTHWALEPGAVHLTRPKRAKTAGARQDGLPYFRVCGKYKLC
jgi:hypothetical protein